jgi:hypothetical protein
VGIAARQRKGYCDLVIRGSHMKLGVPPSPRPAD